MIKIENVEVMGWEHAIRGMRNVSSIRTEKSIKEILWKGKICSISKKY